MTKKTIILLFLVLLKFVVQYFAIDTGYELHRDEYLHLDLGKHLAWGYSSVPPVTALISWLIIQLGNTVFWVKFFPALFGVLTMLVVWFTVKELGGNLFALVLSAVGILSSALLRINTLYQPNSLEFLLWTFLFFTIIKFINSKNNKWFWLASLTFAIGFLNKYNIAFLILGLLPAFAITQHRTIFRNKHLYLSLLVALVIVLPNLIWQYNNNFPVIHHMNTLAKTQLVNVDRMEFLKEQPLFFATSLLVILLAFISFFIYPPFKKFQLFFWSYLFTISLYTYLKAKGYYAMGLYPVLIAFGSVYVEKLLAKGWLRYLQPIMIITPIVITAFIFSLIVPYLSPEEIIVKKDKFQNMGLLRWEDGKEHQIPQDYADMLGWNELAGLVDLAFEQINEKENTIIHCDNYGQAGAINFYSKQNYCEAVSMNADYISWYPLDDMEITNVILVKENNDDDINREREKPLFENIVLIGEIKNQYAREKGAKVYLLQDAQQSINSIFREEIKKIKESQKTDY